MLVDPTPLSSEKLSKLNAAAGAAGVSRHSRSALLRRALTPTPPDGNRTGVPTSSPPPPLLERSQVRFQHTITRNTENTSLATRAQNVYIRAVPSASKVKQVTKSTESKSRLFSLSAYTMNEIRPAVSRTSNAVKSVQSAAGPASPVYRERRLVSTGRVTCHAQVSGRCCLSAIRDTQVQTATRRREKFPYLTSRSLSRCAETRRVGCCHIRDAKNRAEFPEALTCAD